jgi:hypothetical protein
MRMRRFLPVLAAALLVGCGGDDTEAGSGDKGEDEFTFSTQEFEVPVGDSFTCFYTNTKTDRDLAVFGAVGSQSLGGHHTTVYYVDDDAFVEPTFHPCVDAEMVGWRQVAASAGNTGGEPVVELPEGLAMRVPKGKQIVVQSHYINTTGKPAKVQDTITLKLGKPEDVKAFANYWVMVDTDFRVEPNASHTRSSVCEIPQDFQTVALLMHEWGKRYKLELLDADDEPIETLLENDWQPSYAAQPPILNFAMDKPLLFEKGMRLKQTCTWDNTTAEPLMFPREMCIAFAYYYPDVGQFDCETVASDGE